MNTPKQAHLEELLQELTQALDANTSHDLAQELLQRRTELVPLLIDKLEDPATWEAEGEAAGWLPLHAVTLLGIMRSGEAMPALLTAMQKAAEFDHELILEDLPAVFAQIGPPALAPLMDYLSEYRKDDWSRPPAAHGLAGIAYLYPETRDQVLAFLHGLLTSPKEQDPGFLGSMAVDLLDFYAPEEAEDVEHGTERTAGATDTASTSTADAAAEAERWLALWNLLLKPEQQRLAAVEVLPDYWLTTHPVTPSLFGHATSEKKPGRNDPCPCGSGRKYKKCCLLRLNRVPERRLLGQLNYATPGYLESAPAYDALLTLENLTALVLTAEGRIEPQQALEILRSLEPLAARVDALDNVLQQEVLLIVNHSELGEEGVSELRRIGSRYTHEQNRLNARRDLAEYLALLGRSDEAAAEYESLITQQPEYSFGHIGYSRFLAEQGEYERAEARYRVAINLPDEEGRLAAEEGLEELASEHGQSRSAATGSDAE